MTYRGVAIPTIGWDFYAKCYPSVPAGRGGGALECEGYEEEGIAVELAAGGCVLHHGGTAHYSRGNATALRRRAFITNYRPQAMIDLERAQGFDHTGEKKVRNG